MRNIIALSRDRPVMMDDLFARRITSIHLVVESSRCETTTSPTIVLDVVRAGGTKDRFTNEKYTVLRNEDHFYGKKDRPYHSFISIDHCPVECSSTHILPEVCSAVDGCYDDTTSCARAAAHRGDGRTVDADGTKDRSTVGQSGPGTPTVPPGRAAGVADSAVTGGDDLRARPRRGTRSIFLSIIYVNLSKRQIFLYSRTSARARARAT